MVKIKEWKLVIESDAYLDKCPACGFVSKDAFAHLEGHDSQTEKLVAQCRRCFSIVRYEE